MVKQNPMSVEEHIEDPENSSVFGAYPKIVGDNEATSLICDTLRSASMNYDDPHQVEEILEKRMEANLHHSMHSSHALQIVADGLPALGIVAAVLGVIKTMGSKRTAIFTNSFAKYWSQIYINILRIFASKLAAKTHQRRIDHRSTI